MISNKKYILLLLIPITLSFGIHKYYISYTKIKYVSTSKSLQITIKVFIDDIENGINKQFNIDSRLNTDREINNTEDFITKYIKDKFFITVNNQKKNYTFLGKEYDTSNNEMIIYLEVDSISNVQFIEIKNKILMELFSDQQNIIKLNINGKKKSLIQTQEDDKYMLKF